MMHRNSLRIFADWNFENRDLPSKKNFAVGNFMLVTLCEMHDVSFHFIGANDFMSIQSVKVVLLWARAVVKTSNMKISRRHFTNYPKEMFLIACCTCSTMICPHSTNHIIGGVVVVVAVAVIVTFSCKRKIRVDCVSRNGLLFRIKFHITHENKRLLFSTSASKYSPRVCEDEIEIVAELSACHLAALGERGLESCTLSCC